MRNADMSHAQMLNVDLYRADLFRTDFSQANLDDGALNRVGPSKTIIKLRNPNQECFAASLGKQ
ncbi:pentapeptide repeat-containing protein [Vibrio sp. 10N.261.49.A3]|uniref:pentapeptide repeat-containing protein n=1 Tax=Vibrio sp. 10N.261.49.A3 TaxID=3229669 RepID=UPI0035568A5D